MPMINVGDGRRLSYGQSGGGAPLVLVHGSPGEGRAWSRVTKHLQQSALVLTPDLPGYGGSDPLAPGTTQRTHAMAAAVGALIEDCAAPVWLCGHSYGGNVALHAALAQREEVRGLLLLEPVFMRALDLAGEHDVLHETQAFFDSYTDRVAGGDSGAVSMMIDFWFGSGAFPKLPPPVQAFLESAATKNAEDVTAAFAEAITTAQLASFDRPVVIACGDASPPVAPTIAAALAKLLPRAELRAIPGATHGMLDSHAEPVARLIDYLHAG
ncbi:MAG: alpha/beta fold hydrolase [Xanthobacteraceae bacterium]